MKKLNDLEIEIVHRLSEKYSDIKQHIPCLYVQSRDYTGVGIYVNFGYVMSCDISGYEISQPYISTNEFIEMEGLLHGLSWEVDIKDGKLNFIELVTHGEDWNGEINKFSFVPI